MNLILQFVFMIFFGLACWAVGNILLKVFLKATVSLSRVGRYSLAFITGNVGMSYLLTFIGFIKGFVTPTLWTLFLGGVGIALYYVYKEIKQWGTVKSQNKSMQERYEKGEGERSWRGSSIFLIVIISLFLLPAFLQAAAPPYMRDSLVYHLFCPKEYLKVGQLIHIEGNIFSAFPKGHEVLMTLLLAIGGDRAAQGFSLLQQISAIGVLYSLIRLMAGPLSTSLCVIGYATIPPISYFSGCGYVEPALLMTLGGSVLVLFFHYCSRREKKLASSIDLGEIFLIGFLGGWMVALKYSGLIYFGLIGMVLLWNYKRSSPRRALTILGVFSLASVPGFSWMIWNWKTFGNPVYPMGWFLFGGKDWDEARALAMSFYFDTYGMGRTLLDYLLLMWRLAFAGRFDSIQFDGAIGPFLIIFLVFTVASAYILICRRISQEITKWIGLMFIVSAAFFVFGTQQTRFWLPSQMLACVFAAPSIELFLKWAGRKQIIKAAFYLVFTGCLAWNFWFLGKQFFDVGYYKPVFGMEQERDFLVRKIPGYPALEFINQNIPKSSRLLCVWTGTYGYYINPKFYSDTFIEDITLKDFIHTSNNGRELSQRLNEAGFTHLFLNLSILEKNLKQSEKIIFFDFLVKEALDLFRYQNYRVFEICKQ